MDKSIHDQPDVGMRTADFFDDSTDDDTSITAQEPKSIANQEAKSQKLTSSPPKDQSGYLVGPSANEYATQCDEKQEINPSNTDDTYVGNGMAAFLRLTQNIETGKPYLPRPPNRPPRPEEVDTVTYDGETVTPVISQARPVSFQRTPSGRIMRHSSIPSVVIEEPLESPVATTVAVETAKDEHIMNAHTQTLQALLRDDGALQQTAAAQTARISFVPDPESRLPHLPVKKRVSMVPPPLDISGMRHSFPHEIVRTPYPIQTRKSYLSSRQQRSAVNLECETILPLSIRRGTNHSHRPQKVIHITLPASPGSPSSMTEASVEKKEQHFEALDFDDAHLFQELKSAYRLLAGPFRFLSARTLQSIQISHSTNCIASEDIHIFPSTRPCSHISPRSPRYVASQGLTDPFSEQELLRHFRNPRLGKARYAWVHWAKRISSTATHLKEPAPAPPADSPAARLAEKWKKDQDEAGVVAIGCDECTAGLEFVEGWCTWRIFLAVVSAKLLALAAALCWIFLENNVQPFTTGYRNAGGRVEGGAMLGLFVLMIGWTTTLCWLGVSWLIE